MLDIFYDKNKRDYHVIDLYKDIDINLTDILGTNTNKIKNFFIIKQSDDYILFKAITYYGNNYLIRVDNQGNYKILDYLVLHHVKNDIFFGLNFVKDNRIFDILNLKDGDIQILNSSDIPERWNNYKGCLYVYDNYRDVKYLYSYDSKKMVHFCFDLDKKQIIELTDLKDHIYPEILQSFFLCVDNVILFPNMIHKKSDNRDNKLFIWYDMDKNKIINKVEYFLDCYDILYDNVLHLLVKKYVPILTDEKNITIFDYKGNKINVIPFNKDILDQDYLKFIESRRYGCPKIDFLKWIEIENKYNKTDNVFFNLKTNQSETHLKNSL